MLPRILSWRLWTLDVQKASEGKSGSPSPQGRGRGERED